jgi:transposase
MEDWITIRNLKKKKSDLSNRRIGRLLGISHNTVKQALESEQGPEYKRGKVINPEIEPFKDYIEERYNVKKLQGSRVLREIQSKGYKGSKSAFYRYISKIEQQGKRTYHPYETAPGEQAQFDWSPYTIIISGVLTRVYVYSYILGFSRYRIYEGTMSQTMGSVLDALENSMIETGGVPERIQTDNATCFVTNASRDNFQWNTRYLQFCGHYGIKPTRSLPAHPWSKGKVERPFNFLEEQFIKGNEFASFEDFYKRLKNFQEEVNERVHLTTKQTPKYLYDKETSSLGMLPATRYVDIKEEVRKVTSDCLLSYNGSKYSVPHFFATQEVWLKVSHGYRLQIYSSQNKLIAEHTLSLEKGASVINEEHYKNHTLERGNWSRLSGSFIKLYPEYDWFPDKLKTQKRLNPNYHLTQILELTKYYRNEDIQTAFTACMKYNVYTYIFIKGYLQNHSRTETIEPGPIDAKISESIESVVIKRHLNEYKLNEDNHLSDRSNIADEQ